MGVVSRNKINIFPIHRMSVVTVPTGWIRRRVFVNGYGPSYTVQLTEPLYNVMFAVCLSMDSSANILTINGLNQSRATTIDASGNVYNYNYFARNSTVMRSESLVFARHQNGIDMSEISITWLNRNGGPFPFLVSEFSGTEIEFWCYQN